MSKRERERLPNKNKNKGQRRGGVITIGRSFFLKFTGGSFMLPNIFVQTEQNHKQVVLIGGSGYDCKVFQVDYHSSMNSENRISIPVLHQLPMEINT